MTEDIEHRDPGDRERLRERIPLWYKALLDQRAPAGEGATDQESPYDTRENGDD
jgi:hypothetical protein